MWSSHALYLNGLALSEHRNNFWKRSHDQNLTSCSLVSSQSKDKRYFWLILYIINRSSEKERNWTRRQIQWVLKLKKNDQLRLVASIAMMVWICWMDHKVYKIIGCQGESYFYDCISMSNGSPLWWFMVVKKELIISRLPILQMNCLILNLKYIVFQTEFKFAS